MALEDSALDYYADLSRSKKTPLLIEIDHCDVKGFSSDLCPENLNRVPIAIAQSVFNCESTNHILVMDGDKNDGDDSLFILDCLLNQLQRDIKNIKSINAIKETLRATITLSSGGVINDLVGDFLDQGISSVFREIAGEFSSYLSKIVIDTADLSSQITSNIEDSINDVITNHVGDSIDSLSEKSVTLSENAKLGLSSISEQFAKSKNADVLQMTLSLLLSLAVDEPKLLFINNPHKLDSDSIALLSLLFSLAKSLKDEDKHIGVSVVFSYTDTDYYRYAAESHAYSNTHQLLISLRRFSQRYAMLERPNSNIPSVAIKSSTFIGREEELDKLSDIYANRIPVTFSVVSGEPGIGKTSLINQHLNTLRKDDTIVLSIFNEAGSTSNATGLASLENSIVDEEKRLALIESWKDKGLNFVRSIASKKGALTAAGLLFSGVDKAYTALEAGYQRVRFDKDLANVKTLGSSSFNLLANEERSEYFDKLDQAVLALRRISTKQRPIVLFIDDLHWIDEAASEYVLTRLLKLPDVYLIASIRPSDAATQIRLWNDGLDLNKYALALLKIAKVNGTQSFEYPSTLPYVQTNVINLIGLTKTTLNQLIEKTIIGSCGDLRGLTDIVFSQLTENSSHEINTLFAIETLNMLCDENLYQENQLERLILTHPLRINPEIENIPNALTSTFETLQVKYRQSLVHVNSSNTGSGFTLMAYAVLEERLHLLKVYFGELGNTAVNTLLFSSLLGAPFTSELVKDLIKSLSMTDIFELQPLKRHINAGNQNLELGPEHYMIVDEVYEILKRLERHSNKYCYRHGLMHIFLDSQLDYMLEQTMGENQEAFDKVYQLAVSLVKRTEAELVPDHLPLHSLNHQQLQEKLFLTLVGKNIVEKAYNQNPDYWVQDYVNVLDNTAYLFDNSNKASQATTLYSTAYKICKTKFGECSTTWAQNYVASLTAFGGSLVNQSSIEQGFELLNEALVISERYYAQKPDEWRHTYVSVLHKLPNMYHRWHQLDEAIKHSIRLITILEETNSAYTEERVIALLNLAHFYERNHEINKAFELVDDLTVMISSLYKSDPQRHALMYSHGLRMLADLRLRTNHTALAIKTLERRVSVVESCFTRNGEVWATRYLDALNDLGCVYQDIEQFCKAIEVQRQAISLCEPYFTNDSDSWFDLYTTLLSNLAISLDRTQKIDKAMVVQKQVLDIVSETYSSAPNINWKKYCLSLFNMAALYRRKGMLDLAIELGEESVSIVKEVVHKGGDTWKYDYIHHLEGLAATYLDAGDTESAFSLSERATMIIEPLYEENKLVWGKDYADSLSRMASILDESSQHAEAIEVELRAVSIHSQCYEQDPQAWLDTYTTSLANLSYFYQNANQIEAAIGVTKQIDAIFHQQPAQVIKLFAKQMALNLSILADLFTRNGDMITSVETREHSLKICESNYIVDPNEWAEEYNTELINLARTAGPLGFNFMDACQYELAFEYLEKAKFAYRKLYQQNPNVWQMEYGATMAHFGTVCFRVNKFELSYESYVTYFSLFDTDSLQQSEDISLFVYPFISMVHAHKHQSQHLEQDFERSVKLFNNIMFERFGDEYITQLQLIYQNDSSDGGLFGLAKSGNPASHERCQIFCDYFGSLIRQ